MRPLSRDLLLYARLDTHYLIPLRDMLQAELEAKLHLGIAYMHAGKKAIATTAFKAVKGTDGAADLARYWTLMNK